METTQPSDQPIISFSGDGVALGPLRRDLVPLLQRWANDLEVNRTLEIEGPVTLEAAEARHEGASKAQSDALFLIYERSTMRPIGTAGLHRVDHRHRRAELALTIGERDCWGKGYGTETTRLMLDYGFTALGLHNIRLGVHSFNQRGIGAYRRAGFKVVGVLREFHRFGGRAYDVVLMDCLATEFSGSTLAKLLPEE